MHGLPGITVDVSMSLAMQTVAKLSSGLLLLSSQFQIGKSSIYQVTLNYLTLGSTGRYRCEVSEEGPMFATDSAFGDLLVVVVPLAGWTTKYWPPKAGKMRRHITFYLILVLSFCQILSGREDEHQLQF